MKRILLITFGITLLTGCFTTAWAQEPNMSQYHLTPFLTNPGMIGTIDRATITANYRNQALDAGRTYATSTLSAYYPIAIGNHRLGIGASFLNDQVSDFMGTNGGLLGTAYSVRIATRHQLSLGAQAGFFNRRLNSSFSFTTDSQFLDGSFNGDAPTGEVFINQNRNFLTLTTGLFWLMEDAQGHSQAFFGGSIFNVNRPDVGFDEESNMPISLKATGGWRVYQGTRWAIMPNARWIYQEDVQSLNVGTWFHYDLSQSVEYPQQLSIGGWYNNNQAGIVSLQYEQSRYLVGASYDIPLLSDLSTLQQGGIFEIALSFRIGGRVPPRKIATPQESTLAPRVEESEPTVKSPEPVEPEPEPTQPTQPQKVEKATSVDRLAGNQPTPTQPPAAIEKTVQPLSQQDKFVLQKTVRFDLSDYDLTADSKEFLDQVANIFQRNESVKVTLVGHTCNIGTAQDNQQLAIKRAEIVKEYLVKNGIKPERINVQGAGEAKPLTSNATEEGRVQNRRVEFQITQE
ncbi:MAG: PorP/SprF family type IX secretion system membrane protein [Bacteroidota bacterium]